MGEVCIKFRLGPPRLGTGCVCGIHQVERRIKKLLCSPVFSTIKLSSLSSILVVETAKPNNSSSYLFRARQPTAESLSKLVFFGSYLQREVKRGMVCIALGRARMTALSAHHQT